MAAGINDELDKLARLNITFTRNQLAGLILQNSLGTEPELMEEVDRRIEQSLSRSRTGTVEAFESIIRTIGIV